MEDTIAKNHFERQLQSEYIKLAKMLNVMSSVNVRLLATDIIRCRTVSIQHKTILKLSQEI